MKTTIGSALLLLALSSLAPTAVGQIQNNGVVPVTQPPHMPATSPNAPFSVIGITYAALPPNDHYSAGLTSIAAGKAFGSVAGDGLIYSPPASTLIISNQISGIGGLQVTGTDAVNQTGVYNGANGPRCFVQTPAGFSTDSRITNSTWTINASTFITGFQSACSGIDNGVAVGTAFDQIFTETAVHEGFISQLTGYSQTAFAGSTTLGGDFLTGCCARARAIKGDQVVGDTSFYSGLPFPADPVGQDNSALNNPKSAAAMWHLSAPSQTIPLAGAPSMALATNGVQQGGFANSHAVIWSGSSNSIVDLNPAGYFDSRVSGMSANFQVGDGWLGGPANTPGAVRHALLWTGSAASVLDLNQYLPATIEGAMINGVDLDDNIVGTMTLATGQTFGLCFTPNPAISLSSFTLTPSNPAPGDTITATITLKAPAAPGGVAINFSSSNPSLIPAPLNLTIAAGQMSATFSLPTIATTFMATPAPVTLTAGGPFTAQSATVTVTPSTPVDPLVSFTLSSANVATGAPLGLQVNLASPAPASGVLVNFASSNPVIVPAPAIFTIPSGQLSATVSVVTSSANLFLPATVTLQAQTGNVVKQAVVTVASLPTPMSVSLSNNGQNVSPQGNPSCSGIVFLSATTTGSGVISLTSSNAALIVPASVSYSSGAFSIPFTYSALPVSSAVIGTLTATLNGVSASSTITVTASPSPTLQSLTIPLVSSTKTWSSGQTLIGTVTLSGPAFLGGMTVALTTDSPTAVQLPASVTIPTAATSVTFPVTALPVAGPTTVTITATLPGFPGVPVSMTIIPGPALSITSLTLAPYSLIGPGVTTMATVTMNQAAPAGGSTIAISGNTAAAKFPATITVAAGQSSATFAVQGNGVSASTTVTLTTSYTGALAPLGTAVTTTLTVAPTDAVKAPKPTWSTSTNLLSATVTSTNPQATITVLNASGNVPLGTMTNLGNGNFTFQLTTPFISSINFKSNLGGATGQGVTIVP